MRHMHSTSETNYRSRTIYYHDHSGNYIFDTKASDSILHNHHLETPTYLEVKPRFLPPVDDGGAD